MTTSRAYQAGYASVLEKLAVSAAWVAKRTARGAAHRQGIADAYVGQPTGWGRRPPPVDEAAAAALPVREHILRLSDALRSSDVESPHLVQALHKRYTQLDALAPLKAYP